MSFTFANFHLKHVYENCRYKLQILLTTKALYYIGLKNDTLTRFSGNWLSIFIVGDFCSKNEKMDDFDAFANKL